MARPPGIRDLNRKEKALAKQVFLDTLPYEAIRLTNKLGLKNRPYTLVYEGEGENHYHLNVGADGFGGMELSQDDRETLIHELTHVWQSCYSIWPASYIFNSAWNQMISGDDAYKYTAGDPWESYNVEQQAHIVEDWFKGGQQTTSDLYRYIRDNIRSPKS